MRVLVTRPQPGADRTSKRLRQMGHETLELPLFEPAHSPDAAEDVLSHPVSAFIVTSAEVFRALKNRRAHLEPHFAAPLFAVGRATRDAARTFGFTHVQEGTSGGRELGLHLAAEIHSTPELGSRVVYLAGSPRSGELETTLVENKIHCDVRVIYQMQPLPDAKLHFSSAIRNFAPEAILFYSGETVRQFFTLATDSVGTDIFNKTRLLCLSRNIAAMVPESLSDCIEISAQPDEDSLLYLLSQA